MSSHSRDALTATPVLRDSAPIIITTDWPFRADMAYALLGNPSLAEPGARGALLRREGRYSSHIVAWTRPRARRAERPGGQGDRTQPGKSDAERGVDKLTAENARVADELAKAKQANEILGRLSEVLSLLAETSDGETRQNPLRTGHHGATRLAAHADEGRGTADPAGRTLTARHGQ